MITTPPITIERFTELAHRTASRYSHRSEPGKVAYTFLPHTLEHFHHLVCADISTPAMATLEQTTCEWAPDDDDGTWRSACGELWAFIDGGPAENRVTYCHHCGSAVQIKPPHA